MYVSQSNKVMVTSKIQHEILIAFKHQLMETDTQPFCLRIDIRFEKMSRWGIKLYYID